MNKDKLAKDFRKIAREALTGKWSIAVIVALVASLLGGLESGGPELDINTFSLGISVSPP